MSAKLFPPRMLDELGRCCGRKPISYKRPSLHFFCPRCDGEFDAEGRQRPNWAWQAWGECFVPTYPNQDAAKRVAVQLGLEA